jgi:hypothetical protein
VKTGLFVLRHFVQFFSPKEMKPSPRISNDCVEQQLILHDVNSRLVVANVKFKKKDRRKTLKEKEEQRRNIEGH